MLFERSVIHYVIQYLQCALRIV